jgi:hypothetical protein
MQSPKYYWAQRQGQIYYRVVEQLGLALSKDKSSILDVGSAGAPYLGWFPEVPHRTSLDLHHPFEAPGINSVTADFFAWQPDRHYDLALCLQVLEHIPDAKAFAQKLLASADTLIVSVPYLWRRGRVKHHPNDPVDEKKMLAWFGREPSYSYVCTEVQGGERRLICVYEAGARWLSLEHRNSGRAPYTEALTRDTSPMQVAAYVVDAIRRRITQTLGRKSRSPKASKRRA